MKMKGDENDTKYSRRCDFSRRDFSGWPDGRPDQHQPTDYPRRNRSVRRPRRSPWLHQASCFLAMMSIAMLTMLIGMVSIAVPAHASDASNDEDDFGGYTRIYWYGEDQLGPASASTALKFGAMSYDAKNNKFTIKVSSSQASSYGDLQDIKFSKSFVRINGGDSFGGSEECITHVTDYSPSEDFQTVEYQLPSCADAYNPETDWLQFAWYYTGVRNGQERLFNSHVVSFAGAEFANPSRLGFGETDKITKDGVKNADGNHYNAPEPTSPQPETPDEGEGNGSDNPALPDPSKDPAGSKPFPVDPDLGIDIKPMPDSPIYCIILSDGSQYCNYFYTEENGQLCLFTPSQTGIICSTPDCSAKSGATWDSKYCEGGEPDATCDFLGNPLTCIKSLLLPQEDWTLKIGELASEHSDRFPFGIFRSTGAFFNALNNSTSPGGMDMHADIGLICPTQITANHGYPFVSDRVFYYDDYGKPAWDTGFMGAPLWDRYLGCDNTTKYEIKFLEPGSPGAEIMKLARPLLTGAILATLTIGMWLSIGKSALKRLF